MPPPHTGVPQKRAISLAIVVAALGYFVDIYDLILFSIVRIKSLQSLGVAPDEILTTGVLLLNMQMAGMLVGGILWGVLGDKRGRISVLFGSIFLYSIANIANGMVTSVPVYAVLRLVAGIGLAGELGAGVTLVTESMSKETRGYGTMMVATIGIFGAVVAALVGDTFDWRVAYYVGGGMGFCLLGLQFGVYESGMFKSVLGGSVTRGNFLSLFTSAHRARKYLSVIFIALPIWYMVGILITFSPEFGLAMGLSPLPNAGRAVMFTYLGLAVGDLASGILSQIFKNRKVIILVYILMSACGIGVYFLIAGSSLQVFYLTCVALGIANGYWAVFITTAAEQFGTNIRATVTTTAPNFVRGAVVPLTIAFQLGRAYLGIEGSAIAVGAVTIVLALVALWNLEETYGKEMNYLEA